MAGRLDDVARQRWTRHGIGEISEAEALDALELVLARGMAEAAVLRIDGQHLGARAAPHELPAVLRPLAAAHRPTGRPSAPAEPRLLDRLRDAHATERHALLVDHLSAQVRRVLGVAPTAAVDVRRGFADMGLDSLMAVELRNHLQGALDVVLPTTLALEHPTIDALARHLLDVVPGLAAQASDRWHDDTVGPEAASRLEPSEEDVLALIDREMATLERLTGGPTHGAD